MNPVATTVLAAVLVTAGKWRKGKILGVENIIGLTGVALGLAAIDQANQRLARLFSALILVSLAAVYLPDISGVFTKPQTTNPPVAGGTGGSPNRPR